MRVFSKSDEKVFNSHTQVRVKHLTVIIKVIIYIIIIYVVIIFHNLWIFCEKSIKKVLSLVYESMRNLNIQNCVLIVVLIHLILIDVFKD